MVYLLNCVKYCLYPQHFLTTESRAVKRSNSAGSWGMSAQTRRPEDLSLFLQALLPALKRLVMTLEGALIWKNSHKTINGLSSFLSFSQRAGCTENNAHVVKSWEPNAHRKSAALQTSTSGHQIPVSGSSQSSFSYTSHTLLSGLMHLLPLYIQN